MNITPISVNQLCPGDKEQLRSLFTLNDRYGQLSLATCALLSLFELQHLAEKEVMNLIRSNHDDYRKQFFKLRKAGLLEPSLEYYSDPKTKRQTPRLKLGVPGRSLLAEIRSSLEGKPHQNQNERVEQYKSVKESFPYLYLSALPCLLAVKKHLFSSRELGLLTGHDFKTHFAATRKAQQRGLIEPVGFCPQTTGGALKLFKVTQSGEDLLNHVSRL
ncbi:hypothetical protein [Neptuniibacter halophilus]|uniref:hypothetical protein n=1 Tax=Neptuniibacter halophilus TaxID=651666 RepID=UPI0025724115|nr:hypothetical protein [Neptuniibacter halophilus]